MVIEILKECEALLEGHFLLSSGRHSNRYCQCAKLLQYPDKAAKVISVVAEQLKEVDFDKVVGPAGRDNCSHEVGDSVESQAISYWKEKMEK